jgi:hypothetical protein
MVPIEELIGYILSMVDALLALSSIVDACGQSVILVTGPCATVYANLQQIFVSGAGIFSCPRGFSEACYQCSGVISNTCGNGLRCISIPLGIPDLLVACYRIPLNIYGGGEICNWLCGIPAGVLDILSTIFSIPFSFFNDIVMVIPSDCCGMLTGLTSILAIIPDVGAWIAMAISLVAAVFQCACWFVGFLACGGACELACSSLSGVISSPASCIELVAATYSCPGQIYDQCFVCFNIPSGLCMEMFGHDIQYMLVAVCTDITDAITDTGMTLCLTGETLFQPPPTF